MDELGVGGIKGGGRGNTGGSSHLPTPSPSLTHRFKYTTPHLPLEGHGQMVPKGQGVGIHVGARVRRAGQHQRHQLLLLIILLSF